MSGCNLEIVAYKDLFYIINDFGGKIMSNLTEEIKAYEEKRRELERDHFGKWVVVHDKEIVDFYETFQDAVTEAVDRFGAGPYLIREIGAGPVTLPASVLYNPVASHG